MEVLKVGVIGMGFTGQQHVEAIRRIPGAQVVAVSDLDAGALADKAASLGIDRCFTRWSDMITEMQPDIIHNCTPNTIHASVNRFAIDKGIHVFCEKPLATELSDARQLVELAKAAEVAVGVNFNYRSNAMVQEMRQHILNDEIGRVFCIHGHYLQDWLMLDTDYNWRLEEAQDGKSRAIADIGSHWFDLAQFITGKKIVKIFAKLLTVHKTRKKPKNKAETFQDASGAQAGPVSIQSEDAAMILAELEGGLSANLMLSQVSGGFKNTLDICVSGERYSMRWEQELPDRLTIGTRDGARTVFCSPQSIHRDIARYATLPAGHVTAWSDALRNNIGEFYVSVRDKSYRDGAQTYSTFADAFYTMKIVEACMESNRLQAWVAVDPVC